MVNNIRLNILVVRPNIIPYLHIYKVLLKAFACDYNFNLDYEYNNDIRRY